MKFIGSRDHSPRLWHQPDWITVPEGARGQDSSTHGCAHERTHQEPSHLDVGAYQKTGTFSREELWCKFEREG